MKLEQQKEALVLSTDEAQDSIKMELDQDSAQILMQMLSKNLYSDPIGSAVRETASNALDSHRRAGTKKPIIVRFGRNHDDNYEFSVEDFGTGLDDKDVEDIISKYGKSTKRQSDKYLGAFGLGFKSPLAYSSAFYFICRKNGVERRYMMYEGEETNSIDQLYEGKTKEPNGVKVVVPVQFKDRFAFPDKIKEQLCYFEDVYFEVSGITNDFKILRSEHFQMSDICQDRYLHICLDNVYYPIDYAKLGIDKPIYIPIGLRFSLTDGIMPTPNREAIKYSEDAKRIIVEKITKVADVFVNRYNKDANTGNLTFLQIREAYRSNVVTCKIDDREITFTELVSKSTNVLVKPQIENLFYFTTRQVMNWGAQLFGEFRRAHRLYNKRFSEIKVHSWHSDLDLDRLNIQRMYIYTGVFRGITKDYLRSTMPQYETYDFIRKAFPYPLMPKLDAQGRKMINLYELLDLKKHPKSEWRAIIQEFQRIQNMVLDTIPKVEDIVVPQSFIDARKAANAVGPKIKITRAIGHVPCKMAATLERENAGRKCKFVPTSIDVEKIGSFPSLFIYAHHDDYMKLDKYFKFFPAGRLTVKYLTFSTREMEKLKLVKIHNLIPVEEWEKGEHRVFRRLTTAWAIYKLKTEQQNVFNNKGVFSALSGDMFERIEKLFNYKKHVDEYEFRYHKQDCNYLNDYLDKGLLDPTIADVYYGMKAFLERNVFINPICGVMHHGGKFLDILRDMMKYHRIRLDYDNYKLPENTNNYTLIA